MPDSFKVFESFFPSFDGTKIHYRFFENKKNYGTIIITHGQGEHGGSYSRLIQSLADTPWSVAYWDMRGHGLSDGQRGFAQNFNDYSQDFNAFLQVLLSHKKIQNKPLIFLSHSMGATVFLNSYFSYGVPEHKAVILSAPLLGVSVPVPAYKDFGANILQTYLPRITLGNEVRNVDLTRDPEVIREFELDTLRHHKISSGVYMGFKNLFPVLAEKAIEFTSPLLLQISDNDPIVSTPAALDFFDKVSSKDKNKLIYKDAKHENYNDIHRAVVFDDLKNFLKKFEV